MSEASPAKAMMLTAIFFLSIIIVQSNTELDEDPSWLMVQNAQGMDLNVDENLSAYCNAEDEFWSGTLTLEDIDNLSTWFTDRPVRIANELPISHLSIRWNEIFTEETGGAPNAALVFENEHNMSETIVVELSPPTHNPTLSTLTFSVCGILVNDAVPPKSYSSDEPVELFIDDVHYMSGADYAGCKKTSPTGSKTDGSIWFAITTWDTANDNYIGSMFQPRDMDPYQVFTYSEMANGGQWETWRTKGELPILEWATYIEFSVCLEFWNYYNPHDRIALLIVDDDSPSYRQDVVIGAFPYPDQSIIDWYYEKHPSPVVAHQTHSAWRFKLPTDLMQDIKEIQFTNEDVVWSHSTCSDDNSDSTCERGYIWKDGWYINSNGWTHADV